MNAFNCNIADSLFKFFRLHLVIIFEKHAFLRFGENVNRSRHDSRNVVITNCHQKTNEEGMYWNQRGIEKDGRLIKINSQLE